MNSTYTQILWKMLFSYLKSMRYISQIKIDISIDATLARAI